MGSRGSRGSAYIRGSRISIGSRARLTDFYTYKPTFLFSPLKNIPPPLTPLHPFTYTPTHTHLYPYTLIHLYIYTPTPSFNLYTYTLARDVKHLHTCITLHLCTLLYTYTPIHLYTYTFTIQTGMLHPYTASST